MIIQTTSEAKTVQALKRTNIVVGCESNYTRLYGPNQQEFLPVSLEPAEFYSFVLHVSLNLVSL